MEKFDVYFNTFKNVIQDKFSHLSSEAIGWLAVVFIHCATIPSVLSLILGMSDKLPSLDVVMFAWGGLLLMFIRALIIRDMLPKRCKVLRHPRSNLILNRSHEITNCKNASFVVFEFGGEVGALFI